ncbi:MAG: Gfo/Idh/MocA family oxidoreductase [Fibrobacterota bacterium]
MSRNFAITGVGGYIAPRHLKAVKDTGNRIIAAVDPADSVGLLDSYSYDISYFREFERFDRHCEKLRRHSPEDKIDYVSICSPNNLHDAHIRFALRIGADAICEKPLVLNPWNLDLLQELEEESGKRIYNVLQLRLHQAIQDLRSKVDADASGGRRQIELTYITSRGIWYDISWKGDIPKSGGPATNIGIHFFDMLMWIFGKPSHSEVHLAEERKMSGFAELEKADVKWFLSLDRKDLPQSAVKAGKPTFRSITVDGEEIEFSGGFTDLHTKVYEDILSGGGYGIKDARPSIELVHGIRNSKPVNNPEKFHPFFKRK